LAEIFFSEFPHRKPDGNNISDIVPFLQMAANKFSGAGFLTIAGGIVWFGFSCKFVYAFHPPFYLPMSVCSPFHRVGGDACSGPGEK